MKQEILLLENIKLNQSKIPHTEAIKFVGNLLVDSGYVKPRYIEGMLKRDASLSVFVGNYLAIPHGEFEYKEDIMASGIVLAIYPDGLDWQGENVKVVLGLAGIGDEHMEILSSIAVLFSDLDMVEKLLSLEDESAVYDYIMKGLGS